MMNNFIKVCHKLNLVFNIASQQVENFSWIFRTSDSLLKSIQE